MEKLLPPNKSAVRQAIDILFFIVLSAGKVIFLIKTATPSTKREGTVRYQLVPESVVLVTIPNFPKRLFFYITQYHAGAVGDVSVRADGGNTPRLEADVVFPA